MNKDIEALEALLAGACILLNDAAAIQTSAKTGLTTSRSGLWRWPSK